MKIRNFVFCSGGVIFTQMNRIYEQLKNDEYFRDKLRFDKWVYDKTKSCLIITFHEYLRLCYMEGNYKSASDEGVILFNESELNHWHICEDDEVFEILNAFANGDVICIEDVSLFAVKKLRLLDKEKFENKKARYMTKKSVRIYTGNEIIKRSSK